jgi:hypothetical protein
MAQLNVGRVAGSRIYTGTAGGASVVLAEVGRPLEGDLYINTDSGEVFLFGMQPEGMATWTREFNIKGPSGEPGKQGTRGEQGIQGIQGLRGEAGPQGPSVPLVQSVGNSNSTAMSQSACTNAFAPRMEKLYEGAFSVSPYGIETIQVYYADEYDYVFFEIMSMSDNGNNLRGSLLMSAATNTEGEQRFSPFMSDYGSAQQIYSLALYVAQSTGFVQCGFAQKYKSDEGNLQSDEYMTVNKIWGIKL